MNNSPNASDTFLYSLNPSKLLYFFDKHNLSTTLLITLISFRIGEFIIDIYNHIFYPLINNKEKGKNIEDLYVTIFSTKLQIGKVLVSFIRIVIIMYLIYFVALIIKRTSKGHSKKKTD